MLTAPVGPRLPACADEASLFRQLPTLSEAELKHLLFLLETDGRIRRRVRVLLGRLSAFVCASGACLRVHTRLCASGPPPV